MEPYANSAFVTLTCRTPGCQAEGKPAAVPVLWFEGGWSGVVFIPDEAPSEPECCTVEFVDRVPCPTCGQPREDANGVLVPLPPLKKNARGVPVLARELILFGGEIMTRAEATCRMQAEGHASRVVDFFAWGARSLMEAAAS